MPVPGGARLARGGRAAGGVHDRPRRALHPGASCAPASACSCTAAPAASAPPRSSSRARPARASTATVRRRGAARAGCGARRRGRSRREGFAEHGPFDVILELVGAPNLPENLQALATGGRIAVIGVSAGAKAELNLLALMGKRARIHGSTLRARPLEEKALAARLLEREVLPLFDARRAARAGRRDLRAGRRRRRLRALRRGRQARQDRAHALSSSDRRSVSTAAAARRTSRRACGTPPRTRAWRPARRATRRCSARTARRSSASAAGSRRAAARAARASGMSISLSAASASAPITTTIFGCTIAISSTTRATHAEVGERGVARAGTSRTACRTRPAGRSTGA